MVLAHRTPSLKERLKMSQSNGVNGPTNTNLHPGDLSDNYLGAILPTAIRRPLDEGACEHETPEKVLISKERWQIVRQVTLANPKTAPYLDWLLDNFSGYSFTEIGEKYGVTRQQAFHKVTECTEYLKKRIKGHQF